MPGQELGFGDPPVLVYCFLAAQVTLPGFTVGNFARSGYLKTFGDSFVRLSHDENLGKGRLIAISYHSIKRNECLSVVN